MAKKEAETEQRQLLHTLFVCLDNLHRFSRIAKLLTV